MIKIKPFNKADQKREWVMTVFKEGKHTYRVLTPKKVEKIRKAYLYKFGLKKGDNMYWFSDGNSLTDDRTIAKQIFLNLVERFEHKGKGVVFMSKKIRKP